MDHQQIIEKAYINVVKEKNNNPQLFSLANKTLDDFEQSILNWNPGNSLKFVEDNLLGEGVNSVSGAGMAAHTQPNLLSFIQRKSTQQKIEQLILLRQETSLSKYEIVNEINKIGLIEALEKTSFQKGSRPLLYVNRLLIIMFPDIFTTIAAPQALNKTAKILDIKAITFAKKQSQIRDIIDDYLIEIGQKGKESRFFESTIGWWIV
ncbi:hypothetical protein ACIQV0_18190 [Lysinibacillus capsici]|uniref:hypothetical protein n=1 Tax=Lysinibacillus capsici TaxID=2115968 RepID=UPI003823F3D8